jgi:hypothetical protein
MEVEPLFDVISCCKFASLNIYSRQDLIPYLPFLLRVASDAGDVQYITILRQIHTFPEVFLDFEIHLKIGPHYFEILEDRLCCYFSSY